jgi:cellulose synthase/poly-beta-1,6-N-acetylglucosamine synthase-like glycosyltransferase
MNRASILIVVKNDLRISRLMVSLMDQKNISKNDFEIIIVENGSNIISNIIKQYSKHLNIKYYHLDKSNMPMARNYALKKARSNIVLFTDADCIVDKNWVHEVIKYFSLNPNIVGVGGMIKRFYPKTLVEKYASNLVNNQQKLNYLHILQYPYVVGANSAFRKDALISIGGFDETLLSGNDVDICYKLGLKNYKISICNSAIVYHENRNNIFAHFRRFYKYSIYQALLFKKYKRISNTNILINPYPYKCLIKSIGYIFCSIIQFDFTYIFRSYFLIIEGLGVFLGNIHGAIKFHVMYF